MLVDMRVLAERHSNAEVDPRALRLRTREMRPYQFHRQAALFCFGMSEALGVPLQYAMVEEEDFDCIIREENDAALIYTPVQLKELAPNDINPNTTLTAELAKLMKYGASDVVIAVHLNRYGTIDFSELTIPKLRVAELWFYGSVDQDKGEWLIYGNALRSPRWHRFVYPKKA